MRRLFLLALVLAAPAVRAAPEASPELAALVPAETLFLAECNDLDGAGRFGPGTAIGKLFAEPEVQAFVKKLADGFRGAFVRNGRGPLAMLGLAPEDFDGISIRRVGLALVDVSLEAEQVDAVVYLETRAGGEKVAKFLKALRQSAEMFGGAAFKESDVRGRKVISTAVEGHEICLAVEAERFVLTTRAARMDDVLKAIDEGHPNPLRAAPRVTRLRQRMAAERNALFCYLDAPAIGRFVFDAIGQGSPEDGAEARKICGLLGLDAIEALGFADVPEGTGYRTEGAVLLKERRGIFALAANTPPSHRFAKMTPADALAYGGETCDLAALWSGALDLVGAIDADTRAELEQGEREGGAMLGLDIRKDLLEAIGTEWAGYLAWPSAGGFIPDLVLFASVRDRERLSRALDTIVAKAGEMARAEGASVTAGRTEFRGTEIRFVEIADDRGEPVPCAPAWAFGEDFVVLALCPQSVKHALMEKPALSGHADFQRLLAVAPRTAVSATYIDLGRILVWSYATTVPILQVVQGAVNGLATTHPVAAQLMAGFRFNFEDLPPAEVLARHLSGMLTYTAVDDDCVRLGFVSDIGAPVAIYSVAFLAGFVVAVLPMSHGRAQAFERERAHRELAEAVAGAAREQETQQLRAENEMLRERLAKLEEQVAELLQATEQEDR